MPDKLRGTAGLSATTAIIVTAERTVFNPYTIALTLAEVPIAIVGTTRGTHLDIVESESSAPLKNVSGTYNTDDFETEGLKKKPPPGAAYQ